MTNAHSIQSLITHATTLLKAQSIDAVTAKLEAQLLLHNALSVNRAWLIAHKDDALEANIYEAYKVLINRRVNGEPIAYILGTREFYGLKLMVTADTLIPRADTETLVETALAKIPLMVRQAHHERNISNSVRPEPVEGHTHSQHTILDLGTGTGAIALAIAKHRPQASVTAVDASQAALDIAIENAQNLNIPNVKFILSDWFSALINEKFDVIVSNPPYIEADNAHLKQGDLRFEPISALASGTDGLDAIRHIIKNAPINLNPHGWLMLEHGYNQASKVAALLEQAGFSDISNAKDLSGIDRVTIGRLA